MRRLFTHFISKAYNYPTQSVSNIKSCAPDNPGFNLKRSSKCAFYEGCVNNKCIYNVNWAKDITDIEVLAIYERLKSDVGIEIPLLLDKERLSKLQDISIQSLSTNDPCALVSSTGGSDYFLSTSAICYYLRTNNEEYKKTMDKMTLTSILKAMYPEATDYDIRILEDRLRKINNKKIPRAMLEQVLFALDLYSTPYLIKDGIVFTIKNLNGGGRLLLKLVSSNKTKGTWVLERKNITALKEIAKNLNLRNLDFTGQFQQYLKSITPTKIVKLNNKNIKFYRTRLLLPERDWKQFSEIVTKISIEVDKLAGITSPPSHVFFTDDIVALAGQPAAGVYLPDYEFYALDAYMIRDYLNGWVDLKTIAKVYLHEKIHYVMDLKDITAFIHSLDKKSESIKQLSAFEEGLTEYLTTRIMNRLGYTGTTIAYNDQFVAVWELFGRGKYDYFLYNILRTGSFKEFLDAYGWTKETLKRWILSAVRPVSFLDYRIENLIPNIEVLAKEVSKTNLPIISYDSTVEENLINKSTYLIVDEIDRVFKEFNKDSISFEDLNEIKSYVLAGNIIDKTFKIGRVKVDDVKLIIKELDNFKSIDYPRRNYNNYNEYDYELPKIGDGKVYGPVNVKNTITPSPTSFIKKPSPKPSFSPKPSLVPSLKSNKITPTPTSYNKANLFNCSNNVILKIISGPKYYGNTNRLYVNAQVANGVKKKDSQGNIIECYTLVKNCSCQGLISNPMNCKIGDRCVSFLP